MKSKAMKPEIVYANILGRTMRCEVVKRMGDTRKEGIAAKAFVEILKLSGKSPAEDKNKLWH